MFYLIFPMSVMFSICVLAANNIIEKEADFALNRGTYRIASDNAPRINPVINATAYTHSRRIVTDKVEYPIIRINYYASASIWSLNAFNGGDYELHVEVPHERKTADLKYDGIACYYDTAEKTKDIWMGTPDIEACKAKAKATEDSGASCEAEIPWD